MKNFISASIFLLLLCTSSLNAQDYSGDPKEIEVILKNIEAFSKHYVNADYNAIRDSYAREAVILPPGADLIKGREAIRKRWELPEGITILSHKITPSEIKIIGDHAYDIGYYEGSTLKKDGTKVSWKGKYLIVWVKENDDWKIYADAWNNVD